MHNKAILWTSIILIFVAIYIVIRSTGIFESYKINTNYMMPAYRMGDRIWASRYKKPSYNSIVCYKTVTSDSMNHTPSICFHRLAGLEGDTVEINDGYLLRNGYIADFPEKRMFLYYAKKSAIYDKKILDGLIINPIIIKDSVVLNLTFNEYKKLSRYIFLHKINKPKQQKESCIAGSTEINHWNASNYGPLVIPKGYCFVLGDNRDKSIDSRYFGLVPLKNIQATAIFGR